MGLQRKIRKAGHSIVVTLPSQLAELTDLSEGDAVVFEYLGRGALRIEKV
ncbi:MAG: AbrB/MazE/SpoVT family DNA-binding domain-containing protein [Thermoplasmata archaeon]